jgi:hypothetical protein
MRLITVNHPLGTIQYTEEELRSELDDLRFLRDAFLVLLNEKVTLSSWDIPYNKEECIEVAKEMYLERTNYSKDFIKQVFK